MNDDFRFERLFEDGLHELAPRRAPDRLRTKVKAETSEVRPRARWLALIKEPPMRINSRTAAGSPTARVAAIMVATLLATLLVISAGVAGARLLAADGPIVVDQSGGGHYTTIFEAVAAAKDGDEILVKPGTYVEAVVVDKDVTLRGDGPVEDIVITAPEDGPTFAIEDGGFYMDPYAILLQDTDANLSDLTFSGEPSEVIASGGAPSLEGLVFDHTGYSFDGSSTSPAGSSIVINRGSAATVRGNTITGGGPIGIFDGSEPLVDGNTLSGGPHIYGFGFGDGAVVSNNTIEGALVRGIGAFNGSGSFLIEGNTIIADGPSVAGTAGRAQSGIDIEAGSPTVRGNSVTGAASRGIYVTAAGTSVDSNQLSGNEIGIMFHAGDGTVSNNVVRGGQSGITIGAGAALVTGNDVEGAETHGLVVINGSPVLRDNHSCGNGENLFTADAATPDIDDSNEICQDGVAA